MKMRFCCLIFVSFLFFGCASQNLTLNVQSSNFEKTSLLYEKFINEDKPNLAQLNLFLTQMPKGGDLHNHYSGSIYAETYLEWVKEKGFFINKDSLRIDKQKGQNSISIDELYKNNALYRKLLTLWSDKDYNNFYHIQVPSDSNFFNAFGYFGAVSTNFKKGLKILKQRALKENVSYIELMLKSTGYSYNDDASNAKFDKKMSDLVKEKASKDLYFSEFLTYMDKIAQDSELDDKISFYKEKLSESHEGIDDENFKMRYQTYVSRNSNPSKVLAGLYSAFKLTNENNLLVGVNIVGPENGVVALKDYNLHMMMFEFLHKTFPKVNISMHAGELTLGMVRLKNLKFHIQKAVQSGAKRVGHGVDLPYEQNALETLKYMKENGIAVEICLTSNEFILGVKGEEHPYKIYSAYKVPLVLATDDSGISRNNLTNEFLLLSSRYKPSYQEIKNYVYNSIKYSFFQDKYYLKNQLDGRFKHFEDKMSKYYDILGY